MGLRFRKSISLLPGVKLNLSKSGPSVSVGGNGLTYNIGSKGEKATVGLPGSGLSYSDQPSRTKTGGKRSALGTLIMIAAIGFALYKNFQQ